MKRNGYFQLLMDESGTYVRLFPPVDGGESINFDELRQYLAFKNYTPDAVALSKVLSALEEPTNFKIDDKKGYSEMEMFNLKVSEDKMTAVVRFYAPSNTGASYTGDSIINDLQHKGIKKGIDEKAISDYLSDKHFCTDYIIARGKAPVQGHDAYVEYFFNTNPNAKPALNQDGTVDFFNLDVISKCEKGQKLATLHEAVQGEDGYNVLGERVTPRSVINVPLRYSKNISVSEDGLTIFSEVDGHVSLIDHDMVSVTDVYEVTDVDTSTGNIDYSGNVLVKGNVKAGFAVQADGNIEVRGVVEGALIDAGGDVIIMRGMNGMGRGKIIAGGNVISKFIENASVKANGYVHSEAIMHSTVVAGSDVEVSGKKGFITGGSVHSRGSVSARVIGSQMGANTEIEVGLDPAIIEKINRLKQSTTENRKKLAQIEPTLVSFTQKLQKGGKLSQDQVMFFNQLKTAYQELKPRQKEEEEELDKLTEAMENMNTDSVIKVSEFAYPGTTIKISDISINVNSNVQHCRFVKEGADIRVKPL